MRRLAPLALVFVAACAGRSLMPTPLVYSRADADPFASVPPPLRSADLTLLYVTDRAGDEAGGYGSGRSSSAAFGTCRVRFGDGLRWEELVALSRQAERASSVPLSLVDIQERGRWPDTPYPLRVEGTRVELSPSAVEERARAVRGLHDLLRRMLRDSPRKEALLYVHGYNNDFADPALVLGQISHFLGREFVPILYSWPAGSGGLLRGYTRDRESGEFTIFHLKELLRALASCEGLERVHVLAHSRGTDVATTALRELFIGLGGDIRGPDAKLGTLILAAPDLDEQVITQRLTAEGLAFAARRTVIYLSSKDSALGLASWLFSGGGRLGGLRMESLSDSLIERLKAWPALQVVDVQTAGHDYFYSDPSASSDLILLLREGRDPGPDRPLELTRGAYWTLRRGYPERENPRP